MTDPLSLRDEVRDAIAGSLPPEARVWADGAADAALSVTREHVEQRVAALRQDVLRTTTARERDVIAGAIREAATLLALLGEARATSEPRCICGHAGLGEHALHPDCPRHGDGPGRSASVPSHDQEQPS